MVIRVALRIGHAHRSVKPAPGIPDGIQLAEEHLQQLAPLDLEMLGDVGQDGCEGADAERAYEGISK